jgi:hypothetical protein
MKYEISEITESANKTGLSKSIIQALIDNLPTKRSSQQNKSLHLLFQNMAFELNRIGKEFVYSGIKGVEISTTYTPEIVKEFIWKPLQNVMLKKDSTTKLTTQDIDAIFLILGRWFSEQGVVIDFPSAEKI